VAWIIPPTAVLLGVGAVVLVLGRMRKQRAAERPPARESVSAEEEERLRRALEELEQEEEAPFL
jgi:cytochrome c-type biogenesis protein CcmH/NrfF